MIEFNKLKSISSMRSRLYAASEFFEVSLNTVAERPVVSADKKNVERIRTGTSLKQSSIGNAPII